MFFTSPRLPNHVRWNRRLSVHTMVAAACQSPSWQCCTFSARKMSLFLTSLCFHGTPWPQFDVKYCSVLARRCQHRCLQSLLSERSVPAKNLTEHIAHSFCVTCVLTSSHSVSSSCGCVQSARIAYPCFPWPRFELDSRRAFHKSPPNELDRHGPSRRGLLDHPSQCSQYWPVDTFSVVTIRRISQMLQVRCVCDFVIQCSIGPSPHHSLPWEFGSCYHGTPWQHRTPSVLRAQNLFCSSHSSSLEQTCRSSVSVRLSRRHVTCCSSRRISLAIVCCLTGRRTTHTVQRERERHQTDSGCAISLSDPCS